MTIKPVADLYLIKYKDGRLYKCTRDAEEAVDAIGFGFEVEEFVSLDNHRAAMLQGAEPVTTAYKLPDDFDFDRFNDVVWLETVASNPHMHSPTTSTIAMVALELNRKLAAGNSPVIPDGFCVAAKTSIPVISDGWVACSERMPELYAWVHVYSPLAYIAEQILPDRLIEVGDPENGPFWDYHGREGVTHWMQLPASPQQEVK
ncbi:TPA: DUF551 domain-containing protein [Enterobacter hormaechei]